jgi:hypothetical protein
MTGETASVPLLELVSAVKVKGKVLTSVTLPALDPLDHFRSFKVTPRAQVRIKEDFANVFAGNFKFRPMVRF